LADPIGGLASAIDGTNVVGHYYTSPTSLTTYGFLWNGSSYSDLNEPLEALVPNSTSGTYPEAIMGNEVGGEYTNGSAAQGFVWNGSAYATLSGPGNVLVAGVDGTTAVGASYNSSYSVGTAMVWQGLAGLQLAIPESMNSAAMSIEGTEIGGSYTDSSGVSYAFVYNGASYTTIGVPDAISTEGLFLSDGQFAGAWVEKPGSLSPQYGFVWNGSSFVLLADPLVQIFGNENTSGIWVGTYLTGIQGANVVGDYSVGSSENGFLWNGSTYVIIDPPGATSTFITGISGQTIVGYYYTSGNPYPFVAVDSAIVVEQASVWDGGASDANWSDPNNWDGTLPTAGSTLIFTAVNQNSNNNDVPANTQFNGITFDATAAAFTLSGNAINLGGDIVNNSPSPQTINLNLALQQDINITAATQSIAIAGNIRGSFGVTLAGPGTVTFSGANSYSGSANVVGGLLVVGAAGALPNNANLTIGTNVSAAAVQLAANTGQCVLSLLTINTNSTLDIANNTVFLNYGNTSDPITAIQSYLQSGEIISSSVASLNASQSALIYAIGSADGADGIVAGLSSGQIEIMPTLVGDAKLQGNVVFGDFQLLSQYFGQGGGWDEGNFTYGSVIDFADFQLLSQNFGADSSALTSGELASLNGFAQQFGDEVAMGNGRFSLVSVPEPNSSLALALMSFGCLNRRRRIKNAKGTADERE
jgi:autotransporter-associated beta strand protein